MKVPVYDTAGKEVDSVELPASVFEAKVNRGLMHQALVRQLANGRQGNHKTKGRSEVRYSTAKIYRQKGTGNARHGSRRAPIFVGGGVAHGPQLRKYTKNMPRKMRRAALRSALTVKAGNGDVVVVDDIHLENPQTKQMVSILDALVEGDSALLLLSERNENVEKSARNLKDIKTLRANYLNIRDLLGYDKIVMPLSALDVVYGFLALEDDDVMILEEVEADETAAVAEVEAETVEEEAEEAAETVEEETEAEMVEEEAKEAADTDAEEAEAETVEEEAEEVEADDDAEADDAEAEEEA